MKRILTMLLCGALMLTFFACNEPKKSDPPKQDPPEWEELIEEYDEWATEYVNWQKAFKANPNSPVVMDALGRWPNEIAEWIDRTNEMFLALSDFPEEKSAFVAEINRISKEISGGVSDDATSADVDTFLDEYDAWADEYVAFYEAHKDDKVSQEYRDGVNELIFESIDWTNKINNMELRIKDADLKTTFTAGVATIAAKIAAANK